MTAVSSSNKTRRFNPLALLRRGEQWLEISSGYHAGDIQSDKPVAVMFGTTVVGNVFAPKISVAGLLYGSTAARETVIQSNGQIWGDVYTGRLEIEPGGKIQGWVSSLDEEGYQTLQAEGVIPRDTQTPTPGPFETGADVLQGEKMVRGESQIEVLRRMQIEAAAALAARAELEQTFEQRLNEVAGEATAKSASLNEELTAVRTELDTIKQRREELRQDLKSTQEQVERQAKELELARNLLNEQTENNSTLQGQLERLSFDFDEISQVRANLAGELLDANQLIDTLNDRIRSLETALQASLQHSSEQEESLLRWQELAEVTEQKVKTLEVEINQHKYKLEEHNRVVEMLKSQRQQAEQAWQELQHELEELRRKETRQLVSPQILIEVQEKAEQLEADLASANSQLQTYEAQLTKMRAEHEQALTSLHETQQTRVADLKTQLTQAKQDAQQHEDALTWEKANLETAERSLAEAQAESADKQAQVEALQTTLQSKQTHLQQAEQRLRQVHMELERLKAEVQTRKIKMETAQEQIGQLTGQATALGADKSQLQEQVGELETAVHTLQTDLEKAQSATEQARTQLTEMASQYQSSRETYLATKEELRQAKLQLEAHEAETETHVQLAQSQGQQLAEFRALVVERDIQLEQIRSRLTKQSELIQKMKEVTTERIGQLQAKVTKRETQLKDLSAVLARYRKK